MSCGCVKARGANRTHGMSGTSEYAIWEGIVRRCTNPRVKEWALYGGRGITVCDRWRASFVNFLADVGARPSKRHSIDRYPDRNGNYEPGNVRWATQREQMRNMSRNRLLSLGGETMCLQAWADRLGLPEQALANRLKRGWPLAKALTTPRGPRVGGQR